MAPKGGPSTSQAADLAARLTREVLHELVQDVAIDEYRTAQLRRLNLARIPPSEASSATNGHAAATETNGTGTGLSPVKKDKDEGLFECCVCGRQIAAARYASHLSGCMGLGGSRRSGARVSAAAAAKPNGFPRPHSAASSHGSDTDTAGRSNGVKRAASSTPTGGAPKPKKPKPIPLGTNGFPLPQQIQMQPLHAAAAASSHPLAKTMSLPSSSPTVTPGVSPTPLHTMTPGRPLPPPPPPPPPPAGLSAPTMQARKSLPGMNHGGGLPAKSPARPGPLHPHPLSSPASHAAAQKSPRPQPHVHYRQQQQQQRYVLNSDRPESDSENSEDEATAAVVGSASAQVPQKMPRPGLGGAPDMRRSATGNGNGAGGSGGGGNGVGGAGTGSAAQKVPRKGMAATPQGRKSVARAVADSGSSDDDASAGSDSE
ncbi:hypothetical protein RHOSPDRAFT_37303 [Rhodotorula sp. JG-1b]|nr:hypothetical protein RHOSPDRAFT_37303 [Rhodotorula sp. JG-1b]